MSPCRCRADTAGARTPRTTHPHRAPAERAESAGGGPEIATRSKPGHRRPPDPALRPRPSPPSPQHPGILRQPAQPKHQPIGDKTRSRADGQHHPPTGRVVGADRLGTQAQQHQQQPRRSNREPGRVHHPALSSLQLSPGPGVIAQERRQCSQQPTQIRATNLTSDPQRLADPVPRRVRQPILQPIQTLDEPTARPVPPTAHISGSPACVGR